MSALGEGSTHALRSANEAEYLKTGNPGMVGGGTYTGTSTEPTLAQYENIFGPAGRDIKLDQQRHKRHQRWHLPDALKGHNQYLTDRIDGLITDKTDSPFTRNILPYVYLENPDQKLKWNVYSFDEGIASRVPYEAAARVLPQTKRSFAGYTIRQGLAIAMEHNFMVSAAGRENFKNQLTQLVGSIQMTNDLDVHVALLQAPSYQRHINEKYHDNKKNTAQLCREYVDLFGIMQKIPNALDWLIEDAKNHLKTWGSQPPSFLLCNGSLTTQLTMTPEKTNYVTNGPDGLKRLAQGPDLPSYRGLSIINSRKFSMDSGSAPRDLLRRRVRVAEYYRIPYNEDNENREYEFYDQSRDTMFRLTWQDLLLMSNMDNQSSQDSHMGNANWVIDSMHDDTPVDWNKQSNCEYISMPNGGLVQCQKSQTKIHSVECCSGDVSKKINVSTTNCMRLHSHGSNVVSVDSCCEQFQKDYAVGSEMYGGLLQRDVYCNNENNSVKLNNDAQKVKITEITNFKNLFDSIDNYDLPKNKNALINNNVMYIIWYVVKIIEQLCSTMTLPNLSITTNALKDNISNGQGTKCLPAMIDLNYEFEDVYFDMFENQSKGNNEQKKIWNLMTKTADLTASDKSSASFHDHDKNREELTKRISNGLKNTENHDFFSIEILKIFTKNSHQLNSNDGNAFYPVSYFIAKHAYDIWYRYHKMMMAWACSIAYEKHTKKLVDPIHRRVHELAHGFLTDLVYQQFAYTARSYSSAAALSYFSNLIEKQQFYVGDCEFKTLFFEATKNHENSILITNNVHQALVSQQCYARPNLHLKNVTPLCDGDAENSCTSLDTNAWLIQAVAGMAYLNYDVCKMFLTSVADSHFTSEAAQMFSSKSQDHKHINKKIAQSLLMVLWMQEEHFDKNVRQKAKQIYNVPSSVKQMIAKAVANCIRSNCTESEELTNALLALCNNAVRNKSAQQVAPFNHAVGSDKQMYFAQAMKNSTTWAGDIPVNSAPVFLKEKMFTFAHANSDSDVHHLHGRMNNNNKHKLQRDQMGYVDCQQPTHGYSTWNNSEMASQKFDWLRALQDDVFPSTRLDTFSYMLNLNYDQKETYQDHVDNIYDPGCSIAGSALAAGAFCESAENECFRFFINVLAQRFFNASSRFFANGRGVPQVVSITKQHTVDYCDANPNLLELSRQPNNSSKTSKPSDDNNLYVMPFGLHFMVGPKLAVHDDMNSSGKKDILILRPNIEHEMLGIIMGRGGTQELGSTFWGQTELSCYDDAQHGIWGMSYKYHERALVTNERNLIRVFDVAFDGYNGGMDQSFVNWNDPRSINEFRQATYAREQAYNGPSMLVMQLPALNDSRVKTSWPNPIVFQQNANGNLTPDPQKDHSVTNLQDNMVFNAAACPQFCSAQIQAKYEQYMSRLEMHQWASIDQNSRPAGECCVGNETSSSMLAFQGTMKVFKDGREMEHTQGSGHLGPSFVGVASVREGRGLQNTTGQPNMIRQI